MRERERERERERVTSGTLENPWESQRESLAREREKERAGL